MSKLTPTAPAAPPPASSAKRKATSEIDDIFSGKKPAATAPVPQPQPEATPLTKNQRKKLKSRLNSLKDEAAAEQPKAQVMKPEGDAGQETTEAGSSAGNVNEDDETFEVLTDETEIAARISEARAVRPKPVVETVEFQEFRPSAAGVPLPPPGDDGAFADSRGLTKGKRRTEDGLGLFYPDELKIGDGEGDTPQCPFECWCCY
ncbi:hypothetical protein BDZ88DRAFT_447755 [Geranomyces variabilis]|nr:hypothetical protein BDZ88DRAFT_447755 [Geranomyces variabilis]KAJ3142931.1 hypothetical protein HDU90_002804 [Geranomyces variabilis]